jgi:hypothetical protein
MGIHTVMIRSHSQIGKKFDRQCPIWSTHSAGKVSCRYPRVRVNHTDISSIQLQNHEYKATPRQYPGINLAGQSFLLHLCPRSTMVYTMDSLKLRYRFKENCDILIIVNWWFDGRTSLLAGGLNGRRDTYRLRINFPFRCFRFSLRTWATAALIWAEVSIPEPRVSMPEQSLSMPKQSLSRLEQSLSILTTLLVNLRTITWNLFWPSIYPGYSFLTEFCPGIRFCSLIRFLPN